MGKRPANTPSLHGRCRFNSSLIMFSQYQGSLLFVSCENKKHAGLAEAEC